MSVRYEITHFQDLPPDFQRAIDQLYEETLLQDPDYKNVNWAPSNWQMLMYEGETWVGVLEMWHRQVLVGETPVNVGGVGGIVTIEAYRGRGYAAGAIRLALDFLCGEVGVEFGLLICKQHLVPYYAGLGWQNLDARLIYQQAGEDREHPPSVARMIYPCGDKPWPSGEVINVRGLPF